MLSFGIYLLDFRVHLAVSLHQKNELNSLRQNFLIMKTINKTTLIAGFLLIFVNGINAQTETQAVRLMNVLKAEDLTNALILVQNVDNVNYRDEIGMSLLMWSSVRGYLDVCKILLDKGAKVNLRGLGGGTALLTASEAGHTEVVKLLIDRGAKLNLRLRF